MNYPSISIMTPTYGRVALLNELVESFLRQDYPGDLELVVLNDLAHQVLIPPPITIPCRSIRVLNWSARYPTMGAKRAACAEACTHDWITPWDDDDISLPWRLTEEMADLQHHEKTYGVLSQFFYANADDLKLSRGGHWGPYLMTRQVYEAAGGYPLDVNSGQDVDFRRRAQAVVRPRGMQGRPGYLYRWGTGHYHLSGHGRDREGKVSGYDLVQQAVMARTRSGEEPSGDVVLEPHWRRDYVAWCQPLMFGKAQP